MTGEALPEERFDEYVRKLRAQGETLRENLVNRVEYATLYDAIGACHAIYDLLEAIRRAIPGHTKPQDEDFLTLSVGLGLEQVKVAMSHGFEVYGQELDPIKYRLNVAVAIARYAADHLS